MTEARSFLRRIVLICVLLELIAAAQVRSVDGAIVLVTWLRAVARPVTWSAERLGAIAVDVGLGFRDLRHVVAENQRLKIELTETKARLMLLREDFAAMSEADDLVNRTAYWETGAILGRCSYRNLRSGTMEVRTASAVRIPRDSPAVTASGLVGRVVHSEGRRHWLELLIHPAAAVAVETKDGDVHALAVGTGSQRLEVMYVPRQASLVRGLQLFTSGADGVFPSGIPVASIDHVRESDHAFLEVEGVPSADLHSARLVLLLPAWSPSESRESR